MGLGPDKFQQFGKEKRREPSGGVVNKDLDGWGRKQTIGGCQNYVFRCFWGGCSQYADAEASNLMYFVAYDRWVPRGPSAIDKPSRPLLIRNPPSARNSLSFLFYSAGNGMNLSLGEPGV